MMNPLRVITWLALVLICALQGDSQAVKSKPAPSPTPEIVITPLTDDDRKLDLKKILSEQPDYVADESFFYWEGFGGFTGTSHVAQKGKRKLGDTGFVKVVTDGDQDYRLNDSNKTFDQSTFRRNLVLGNGHSIDVKDLVSRDDVEYQMVGNQVVNNHPCLKVEAKLKGNSAQIFLYVAKDLRYLVVAIEVLTPPKRSTQQLTNISLEVPDKILEIPADYKPLPKHIWTRLTNAKTIYEGKPAKEASVFRSDDGSKLFVALSEPHPATGLPIPWTYLVFLKENKVEVAYQGTLVTEAGEYAAESTATKAISKGEETPSKDNTTCEKKGCPKMIATASSVYFPSVYWDDRKAMVKVVW